MSVNQLKYKESVEYYDNMQHNVSEFIKNYWWEKCDTFEEKCPVCQAWKAYDIIFQYSKELI